MQIDAGLNLQDLRYFLALARHGRLVVAAERLGVEHTTVSRRVQALEKAVGLRLFERTKGGWELTDPGRRLFPHAERIEESALDALDDTTGGDQAPSAGVVRLVTTDGFGARVVVSALARLNDAHPEICVELRTTSQLLSYRVGEFDIALTLHRPHLPRLLARKLCDYSLRLYAAPDYISRHPAILNVSNLSDHRMIWYIDSLLDLPELQVMNEVVRAPQFAMRSSNVFAQLEAVAQGMGVGLLPSFLAEQDPRLVPVLAGSVDMRRTQWLLTTKSLANVRRIQIVYQHLMNTIPNYADLLIPE